MSLLLSSYIMDRPMLNLNSNQVDAISGHAFVFSLRMGLAGALPRRPGRVYSENMQETHCQREGRTGGVRTECRRLQKQRFRGSKTPMKLPVNVNFMLRITVAAAALIFRFGDSRLLLKSRSLDCPGTLRTHRYQNPMDRIGQPSCCAKR